MLFDILPLINKKNRNGINPYKIVKEFMYTIFI